MPSLPFKAVWVAMLIGSADGDVLATFPKPIEVGVIADVIASVGIILLIIEFVVFSAVVAVIPTPAIEFICNVHCEL